MCRLFFLLFLSTMILLPMAPNAFSAGVDRSILPATNRAGYYGYICAETGKPLFPFVFLEAGFFSDGVAIVKVGENAPLLSPGFALIEPTGMTTLHGVPLIKPAYADDDIRPPFLLEGDGALPRVFIVYDAEVKGRHDRIFEEIGVYHVDKGWLLPKSKMGRLKFINSTTFIYEGDLFIDGKKFPMPRGFRVDHVDFENGYVCIRERGEKAPPQYGVLRLDGSVWVPPKYHDLSRAGNTGFWLASRFSGNAFALVLQVLMGQDVDPSPKKDYVDTDVFDVSGKKLRSFSSHDLPYVKDDTYEYNKKGHKYVETLVDGTPVTPPAPKPVSGYLIFTKGKYQGIQDAEGNVLLSPMFEEIKNRRDGQFAARGGKNGNGWKWGLISLVPGEPETFHTIMPFIYSDILLTRTDVPHAPLVIEVEKEKGNFYGKYGLAGRDGTILRPPTYYNSFFFNAAGLAVVYEFGAGNGILDMKGEEVLPTIYKTIFDQMKMEGMKEPVFIAEDKDGKWGLIKGSGEILLPFQYGYISYADKTTKLGQWFRVEDLEREKVGAYNYTTRVLIPPHYRSLDFSEEGVLAYTYVSGKGQHVFFDVNGKNIKELSNYRRMKKSAHPPYVYTVEKESLTGLVDATGKEIFPCRFTDLYEAGPFYFRARDREGLIFYVDRSGKEYRPRF